MGWPVIEMNASDARNKIAIEQVAGRASLTSGFPDSGEFRTAREGGRTLILLDEADCLTGRIGEEAAPKPGVGDFREFLRARYQSVESLNRAWGLGGEGAPTPFAGWEAAPSTGGRAAWTRLPVAQRDLAEWRAAASPRDLSDRGGLGAISRLVRETRQPLALTVNDASSLTRYSPLFRSAVERIRFEPVPEAEMRSVLRRIVVAEGFRIAGPALDHVIRRNRGDLRGALNDLDAASALPPGPAQQDLLGFRDRTQDFFEFTDELFRVPRFYRSVEVQNRLDATPDDLLPWIEENVPRATRDPRARLAALEVLARAELFLTRARRQRVYALWSFASELMTGGTSLALSRAGPAGGSPLAFPQFLSAMGRSKATRALRASIEQKVGRGAHVSRRKSGEIFLPMLTRWFRSLATGRASAASRELCRSIVLEADLSAEEVGLLMDREPDSSAVRALVVHDPDGDAGPPSGPAARRTRTRARTAPASPASRRPSAGQGQRRLAGL
jgi:DNA polymerase III delta prime subunit